MVLYSQRCARFHDDVFNMDEQALWDHMKAVQRLMLLGEAEFESDKIEDAIVNALAEYKDKYFAVLLNFQDCLGYFLSLPKAPHSIQV